MKQIIVFTLFVCFKYEVDALSFPKPRVYVVTPATRTLQIDEDKSAPFYYHKWMKRMDTGPNTTTTTTTVRPKVLTPDLIFAEFESDGSMQKSIRKLLDKEKIVTKSSTMSPIYVPEEDDKVTRVVTYGLPVRNADKTEDTTVKASKPHIFNNENKAHLPVYLYSSPVPTSTTTTTPKSTTTITTTTESPVNIENIWHIIDNEKSNQQSKWEELPVVATQERNNGEKSMSENEKVNQEENYQSEEHDDITIDEHFAVPGFATNPGNGAENESRAIRTEQDIKFPYINLKPFQMKSKTKHNSIVNNKKSNTLTTLDQFTDLKNPVRGEVQDIVYNRQPIDRYNPAQPYLPVKGYDSKVSKQSSPIAVPTRATSNLVPPPPPLPKYSGANFPQPVSYDSFPPYAPSSPDFAPAPVAAAPQAPPATIQQSIDASPNSDTSDGADIDSEPPMDLGYRYKPPTDNIAPMMNTGYEYKPPAPPIPQFVPTLPPPIKQFDGYHYNKPVKMADIEKPEFEGYHYPKPEMNVINNHMPPSYGSPPSIDVSHQPSHDPDYPDLIFDKPQGDLKGGHIKDDAAGMMPPPLPNTDMKPESYGPPTDDHGFPSDFPTDFKFHHDFEDHDHDYHFHHDTTTTTETPRVNRFSYYYLGKKLYYLPLYFSVYFIVYVAALIIKAVLRHKIVYPNSWRPNTTTSTFFSKRSVDEFLSNDNLQDLTHRVTRALATAAEKYMTKTKTG